MSIWLVRAGSHGEYEQKFLSENRVYVTWDELDADLSKLSNKAALQSLLEQTYPKEKTNTLRNWMSQLWPFAHSMAIGDLVVVPLKSEPVIYIGEITSEYQHNPAGPDPFYHFRTVNWIGEAIPRYHFGQDLLYSFGAFMTICRIQRNHAEARLEAMRASHWAAENTASITKASGATQLPDMATDAETGPPNLEELARDQIASLIAAKFKGHGLTRLIEAILKAQGYTTFRSPEGPDGVVDILAGAGPLGFEAPRLCVQVKSQDTPVEAKVVHELLGAMQSVNADQGLLVSWNGFKSSVPKMVPGNFFRLRLWTQKEVLEQLFAYYDQLDEEIKAELPLKRIWVVTAQEE
jgi:restriction system protein